MPVYPWNLERAAFLAIIRIRDCYTRGLRGIVTLEENIDHRKISFHLSIYIRIGGLYVCISVCLFVYL